MSKFNVLSAAVVVAVAAIAAPAQAYTVSSAAPNVAYVDVADAATPVTTGALNVKLTGSDLIIGRTVGFSIKFTLKNGAQFNTAVTVPAVGAAVRAGGPAGTPWVPTVAAGGTPGDDYVILLFSPGTTPASVTTGDIFAAAGLTFSLKNVGAALASAGSTVSAEVMFADPGTAAPIMEPAISAVILKSVDPLAFDITAGDVAKTIDVGTENGESKTTFAADGEINSASPEQHFVAGVLDIDVVTGTLNAAGAAFTWAAGPTADKVDLTISGDSFKAFKAATPANGAGVYLTAAGTCAAGVGTPDLLATGVVADASVTFTGVDYDDADGAELCFVAPAAASEVVIDASKLQVAAKVTRTATSKNTSASDAALPLVYNGPFVEVDSFNPGSNASVVSYLRITNPSATAGKATIERICDDGVTKGSTTVSIAAGATVALTAKELEDGGSNVAVGYGQCGANQKGRLTVTGEFIGMKVQNFLRNTGTVVNTNVNNQN